MKSSEKLSRALARNGLTTDLSEFMDQRGVAFIGLLTDITKFAKKYGLTEIEVYRHILVGEVPCVLIDGHAFAVDLGFEGFHKHHDWALDERHIKIIHRLLQEELDAKVRRLRQRNSHRK